MAWIRSLALIAALLLAAPGARAVTVALSDVGGMPGDVVTSVLSVTDVDDLISVGVTVTFDEGLLEFVEGRTTSNVPSDVLPPQISGDPPPDGSGSPVTVSISGFATAFTPGALVELDFEIKNSAPPGSTALEIVSADLGVDLGDNEISLPNGAGTLSDGSVSIVPEPISGALLLVGLAGLGAARRRRARA